MNIRKQLDRLELHVWERDSRDCFRVCNITGNPNGPGKEIKGVIRSRILSRNTWWEFLKGQIQVLKHESPITNRRNCLDQ